LLNIFSKTLESVVLTKPGAMLFNASSNEQMFPLNPRKKIGADSSCRFREKRTL